jgi:hypothetical protein
MYCTRPWDVYNYMCMRTRMCTFPCTCTYMSTCNVSEHVCVYMYVSVSVDVHFFTFTCTFTWTWAWTWTCRRTVYTCCYIPSSYAARSPVSCYIHSYSCWTIAWYLTLATTTSRPYLGSCCHTLLELNCAARCNQKCIQTGLFICLHNYRRVQMFTATGVCNRI